MGSIITTQVRGVDPDFLVEQLRKLAQAGRIPIDTVTVTEISLLNVNSKAGRNARIVRFSFDVGAASPLALNIDRATGATSSPMGLDGSDPVDGQPCRVGGADHFVIHDAADGGYQEHERAIAVLDAIGSIVPVAVCDSTDYQSHRDEIRLIAAMAVTFCIDRAQARRAQDEASEWN